MTPEEAEAPCVKLAVAHNCDYKFKWLERRKRFRRAGGCFCKTKTIRPQPRFVELNREEVFTQVILHGVAHALTPKHGHNKFWKKKAIEIGRKGVRCYGKEVKKL